MQVQTKLNEIPKLASEEQVAYVEIAEALKAPTPVARRSATRTRRRSDLRRFGKPAKHKYGEDVLIGIVDVQGFDFAHPDFLDGKGKTRFVRDLGSGRRRASEPASERASSATAPSSSAST